MIAEKIMYKGGECIKLENSRFIVLVAPSMGSSILRFFYKNRQEDIFHFNEDATMEQLKKHGIVIGLPTLFLPNRLKHGKLHVSDYDYQLPINDKFGDNFIHGFLHTRQFQVEKMIATERSAKVVTFYEYNEEDEFFFYFPVKFRAVIEVELLEEGVHYEFSVTNLSNRKLPFGTGTHTSFHTHREKYKEYSNLFLPISSKVELDETNVATGKLLPLGEEEQPYINGTKKIAGKAIDDEMYVLKQDSEFYGAVITNPITKMKIMNEVSKEYGFVVLWNCGGNMYFSCIEPMTWMINAPNLSYNKEKSGYVELAPNESKKVYQNFWIKEEQ